MTIMQTIILTIIWKKQCWICRKGIKELVLLENMLLSNNTFYLKAIFMLIITKVKFLKMGANNLMSKRVKTSLLHNNFHEKDSQNTNWLIVLNINKYSQPFFKKLFSYYKKIRRLSYFCCLNFWDEAWCFLSISVFGLLSSSLLFPQRSVKVPEFYKRLKKAGGHIGRNIVEITLKMKITVRKPFVISC